MLALYRCGRGSEALTVYRDGHRLTAAELGLDPGPRLRELQRRILVGDSRLDYPDPADATVEAPSPLPVPRQLPADTATFTGRETEVARLSQLAATARRGSDRTALVVTVDGMAGIGKTTLAVHVAHRLAPDFPDGQLFIDLHGFSGDVPPVTSDDALHRLLRTLGVTETRIPTHPDDKASLFRSLLNSKRVLLLLDNAAGEAQVRPLLPGGPDQLTMVTSRRRLPGLDDAINLDLELLDPGDAAELFRRSSGVTTADATEPSPISEIVELCGGLPLAIRLAASRLRRNPSWTPTELFRRLRRSRRTLATLSTGERSVATAFRMSYLELDNSVRRTFRLLSLYPGSGFGAHTVAALADLDLDTAEEHLDELTDAQLLQTAPTGDFGFHDLVRQFAAQESAAVDDLDTRDGAVTRLLDSLRYTAFHASVLVDKQRRLMPNQPSLPRFPVPRLTDTPTALRWYDGEASVLRDAVALTVEHGLNTHAWQLAHTTDAMANARGHLSMRVSLNETSLVAARRLDDPDVLARILNNVANAYRSVSRSEAALTAYREALTIWRDTGDVRGQATANSNLGITYLRLGRLADSQAAYEAALDLAGRAGDAAMEVRVITNLAATLHRLGRHDHNLENLNLARDIATRLGDELTMATVDNGLGVVWDDLGASSLALEHNRRALAVYERVQDSLKQCDAHNSIAATMRSLGRLPDALRHHRCASNLVDNTGDANRIVQCRNGLARTLLAAGHIDAAIGRFCEAAALAKRTDDRYESARSAHGLADALIAAGDTDTALRHLDTAIAQYDAMGVPGAAALRRRRQALR